MGSKVRFIKYHGLGNDFIVLCDDRAPLSAAEAVELCRRGDGVGADGVMLARPSAVAALRMELTNSDGSIPEMCGNGLRCFVKYAVDVLGHTESPLAVETLGGVRLCTYTRDSDGRVDRVRVDMGAPSFERARIPMTGQGTADRVEVAAGDRTFVATGVNTGNPHMVLFGDASIGVARAYGPILTDHPHWPLGANVEFAAVTGPRELDVTVWERGCGLTRACGTGATATAAAAVRLGLLPFGAPLRVHLPGGDLDITIEDGFRTAWMEGPATEVYRAELSADLRAESRAGAG